MDKGKPRRKSAANDMEPIAEDELTAQSPTRRQMRRPTIMSKSSDEGLSPSGGGGGKPASLQSVGMSFRAMNITRRLSMRPEGLGSVDAFRRQKNKPQKLENTYKLNPDENDCFVMYKVRDAIESVLKDSLEDMKTYGTVECSMMTGEISDRIKMEVKDLGFPRHKIVVHVVIGQKLGQSIQTASRCVWNSDYDSSATGSYENAAIFATATVFGITFD